MSKPNSTKPGILGFAAAIAGAAMFMSLDVNSGPGTGIAATGPGTVSEYIVVAGNTPSPPPPRLTYQQAKRLGFVKPSNP